MPSAVWSKLRGANGEGVLLLVITVIVAAMAIISPGIISASFVGDIARSAMVNLALAMGLLMVIISGGFDVSFMAVAIFAGYSTIVVMERFGLDGSFWPFLLAGFIGLTLSLLNVLLVGTLKVPTLIATLGTQAIFRGTLLAFVGSAYIAELPAGLDALGKASLFSLGDSPLSVLLVPVALICVLMAFVLSRTYYGRSIYALGGSVESARRAGIPVLRVHAFIFMFSGLIAGIAGLIHITINRTANPFDLVGNELNVIAAVVIGGAVDTGGRGSVSGTVLGVILIAIVQNSLVRLGVPSFWHLFVTGLFVLVGVSAGAIANRVSRGHAAILEVA